MATSPLATALKPNVSAGSDAEAQYQSALNQLMQQLDVRKNRPFDPSMLALAAGFLSPTQTGSFGESLGIAAKGFAGAEGQRQKEDLDLAQMRLQVAQSAREQASRLAGQQAFRGMLGGQGEVLNAPGAQGAEGVGATTGAPAKPTEFGGMKTVTINDALAFAAAYPELKDQAKLLLDAAKAGIDRYAMSMNGTVFDKWTEKFLAGPGQTSSEYMVPELGENRTLKMTPNQHDQYQQARDAGLGREWVKNFMSPDGKKWSLPSATKPEAGAKPPVAPVTTAPEKPPVTPATTTTATPPVTGTKEGEGYPKPKSQIELEAEREASIIREKEIAKSEAERYSNAVSKGDDAGERISMYNRLKATALKPDANKIFGVFENGKFSDAVMKYLESNKGVISANNIRDLWTEIGLDPKLISDKQLALSIIAQQQFAFSSLAKGQGAISDFERSLFNAMGASIQDRPETIVRKMDMLTARAEFDKQVSKLARDARKEGIKYDDMKDMPAYKKAYENYTGKLMDIVMGSGRQAPQATPQATPPATRPATPNTPSNRPRNPAADKLRSELGF